VLGFGLQGAAALLESLQPGGVERDMALLQADGDIFGLAAQQAGVKHGCLVITR